MTTGQIGPIRASRLLRATIRRAREAAGLTQVDVAASVRWSLSKLQRIEAGEVGITTRDVEDLSAALDVGDAVARDLARLTTLASARGWWYEYRTDLSPIYTTIIGIEAEADRLSDYAVGLVPGLLQTPAYARAVLKGLDEDPDGARAERMLAVRLRRQQEVFERPEPPEMAVLLDEGVLHLPIGGRAVMADQVRWLVELARRPQIAIRVVPFEVALHRGHSFLTVADTLTGTTVYLETLAGDFVVDNPRQVAYFARQFTMLWDAALDPARTGQLLRRVADSYAAGANPRPWLWA